MLLSAEDPDRRRAPRILDADWLVLRALNRALEAAFARCLGPGMTLLDFGCGSQPYRQAVTALGCAYVAADLGDGGDVAIGADGRLAAADATADAVGSFQVLEHVRDVGLYLGEAHRVLRPDGRLLLSTHGVWLYHPHPEDHRRWTRQGLVAEVEAAGFTVQSCEAIVGPLAWTTVVRLTGFTYALRKAPLIGPVVAGGLALVMNARAWLEDRLTPAAITADNACVYLVTARRR